MKMDAFSSIRSFVALSTGISLSLAMIGCTVGPKYHPPSSTLAPFHNAPEIQARTTSTPAPPIDSWWSGFHDPELDRIVRRALDQNLDLAAAVTRVTQSRAIAKQMGAIYKPQVNLLAQNTAYRQSLESEFGRVSHSIPGFDRNQNYYDLGVAASWEVDLFGQLKSGAIAATDEAQAAEAERVGTRISVIADAADSYFQIRGDQQRIAVTLDQIERDEHLLKLIRQRFDAGVATDREVAQAEALVEQAKASLPPLRVALEAQLNRLDVLMGAQPGTYAAELSQVRPVPDIPAITDPNNPVNTLRRRPDVIAAERRLAASNARIGGALAGYYPTISLSAILGSESIAPGHLFQSNSFQPVSVAGLRWRIFDFGRVNAEVAQARGANAEALILYRQTVLHAAEDVEDAFMNLSQTEVREREIVREVDALRRARDRSQEAYTAGTIALTDVLDADRQLLVAQDDLAFTRANAARAAVSSFRALGGGWNP
jgi:NodT family efflux transporter outer membrane factor (OMF) lipoprotein